MLYSPSRINMYAGAAYPAVYDAIAVGDVELASQIAGRIGLMMMGAADAMSGDYRESLLPPVGGYPIRR